VHRCSYKHSFISSFPRPSQSRIDHYLFLLRYFCSGLLGCTRCGCGTRVSIHQWLRIPHGLRLKRGTFLNIFSWFRLFCPFTFVVTFLSVFVYIHFFFGKSDHIIFFFFFFELVKMYKKNTTSWYVSRLARKDVLA